MTLVFDGYAQKYEIEALSRVFFPYRKMQFCYEYQGRVEDDVVLYLRYRERNGKTRFLVVYQEENHCSARHSTVSEIQLSHKEIDRRFSLLLYSLLCEETGVRPQWGILTGIRPVKLVRSYRAKGMSDDEIISYMGEQFLTSSDKVRLALATEEREQKIINTSTLRSFSLYVSVPFCPTRCSYCSFVSQSIEKMAHIIPSYHALLLQELEETAKIAKQCGLRLETVYIGGGTPTTLSAEQLTALFQKIAECFDLSTVREYTVEAGRADTITKEKLEAIYNAGVTRISINPQTFSDSVLREIGRSHTAKQVLDAYQLAREVGFDNINMDIIAGLPTDTVESFRNTMDTLMRLDPENVTVHTLTLKRSSTLYQNRASSNLGDLQATGEMVSLSQQMLMENGYFPYYLYRQKNTLENLENVGYAKPGYEGLYNVFIMDETHTILAVGAAGSTKLVEPNGKIERVFNLKYPIEYERRFDELLQRKGEIINFYNTYFA